MVVVVVEDENVGGFIFEINTWSWIHHQYMVNGTTLSLKRSISIFLHAVLGWEDPYLNSEIFLYFFLLQVWLRLSSGQNENVSLSSTSSTVTLQWTAGQNASVYQVYWFRSMGIYFTDAFYTSFKPGDRLNYTAFGLQSGVTYTFILYRNGNGTEHKIFTQNITTGW